MRNQKTNKRGFTLMELLVAIAIIGILTSVVSVATNSHRAKSRDARRVSELHSIEDAINLFFQEKGFFPACIYPDACDPSDPDKNYIANIFGGTVPRDPSGEPYHYDNSYGREGTGGARYCIGTNVEHIEHTARCDIAGVADDQYVLRGP